jgi:hypothetical protein
MPRGTRTLVALLASVALALAAAACGDDDVEEAQPVPGAASFGEGGFDDLPRYPGAEAVSDPTVEDDVTSQSYTIATATPDQVFDQLADDLSAAGWSAAEEPETGADDTFRGVWQRDDQEVVLSATTFADPDGTDEETTQYSYSLGPA